MTIITKKKEDKENMLYTMEITKDKQVSRLLKLNFIKCQHEATL